MIVVVRRKPHDLPIQACSIIEEDITTALNQIQTLDGKFIVNDTRWYFEKTSNEVAPFVMNEAAFISQQFERNLRARGWSTQFTSYGQRIDGHTTIPLDSNVYDIDKASLRKLFMGYWEDHPELHPLTVWKDITERYLIPGRYDIFRIEERYRSYFTLMKEANIRVGLEFETGNIASAFRAFEKLRQLHANRVIDAGIFITTNKPSATRIWPPSNRNASFDELENRNYQANIDFPLWEFTFEPDGFASDAPYLKRDGTTYLPKPLNEMKAIGRKTFQIYIGREERQVLLPLS